MQAEILRLIRSLLETHFTVMSPETSLCDVMPSHFHEWLKLSSQLSPDEECAKAGVPPETWDAMTAMLEHYAPESLLAIWPHATHASLPAPANTLRLIRVTISNHFDDGRSANLTMGLTCRTPSGYGESDRVAAVRHAAR